MKNAPLELKLTPKRKHVLDKGILEWSESWDIPWSFSNGSWKYFLNNVLYEVIVKENIAQYFLARFTTKDRVSLRVYHSFLRTMKAILGSMSLKYSSNTVPRANTFTMTIVLNLFYSGKSCFFKCPENYWF